jgi:5-formyltetrahydrofolate cyclo-ligase
LLGFEGNGSHRHSRVTPSDSLAAARVRLRAELRARRRALSPGERQRAAHLVARNVDRKLGLRAGARVALYCSLREELDSAPLFELARQRGWRIFLPRIERTRLSRKMRFVACGGAQRINRLGIREPQGTTTLAARWLDAVFVPLVGFDAAGMRLGMGAGFYDRAFAYRRWRNAWHKPRLIGVAYAFQQVAHIEAAAHDVRLDAVVTDQGVLRCITGY